MYLRHNLNGEAARQMAARPRRGLVVADRVRTVTLSADGFSSFGIYPRRHPRHVQNGGQRLQTDPRRASARQGVNTRTD